LRTNSRAPSGSNLFGVRSKRIPNVFNNPLAQRLSAFGAAANEQHHQDHHSMFKIVAKTPHPTRAGW
jgi:hypothetical protein